MHGCGSRGWSSDAKQGETLTRSDRSARWVAGDGVVCWGCAWSQAQTWPGPKPPAQTTGSQRPRRPGALSRRRAGSAHCRPSWMPRPRVEPTSLPHSAPYVSSGLQDVAVDAHGIPNDLKIHLLP